MRSIRKFKILGLIGALCLFFTHPVLGAQGEAPLPKAMTVPATVKAPAGPPWSHFKFGMNQDQTRKLLGTAIEPLRAPYRLGDYVAEFRGAPIQITKGVAMRPLPLFHWKSGSLEMLVLTMGNAKGRDFVEVYQLLTKTYGASRHEHSQFQGPFQAFDVSWKSGGSAIALYFDESGKLLTLELARATAASPEPYGELPWLHASEWADLCACDMPLYFNRCNRAERETDVDSETYMTERY